MNPLIFKIFLNLRKLKKDDFLGLNEHTKILNLLCNKTKIRFLKIFICDIFLLLKSEDLLDFKFNITKKSLKILFISLFTCKDNFYNIIFNNKTEFNTTLRNISMENSNILNNIFKYKYKKIQLIKLAKNFNEYYNNYLKWERVDKRINTQKLLIDYFEIKINIDLLCPINNSNSSDIIKEEYIKELDKIETNIKYMKDNQEVEYFNENKDNFNNYQKIQEELYWKQIKYEISCEDKYKNTILKLIEKTKKMFINCIPNNLEVQNEINDNLDLEILNNMLSTVDNKSIDYNYLEGKLFYIVSVLKKFQSPNSDSSCESWCEDIQNKLNEKIYYKDFIPFFFKELFNKIITILDEIQKFKENLVI